MRRSIWIVLLLVVAAGIVAVVGVNRGWFSPLAIKVPDEPLFDPPVGRATALTVTSEGRVRCHFVRDGDRWRLACPATGPGPVTGVAKSAETKRLVNSLTGLRRLNRYAPDDPARPNAKQTGLDKPQFTVAFTDESGVTRKLQIGKAKPRARQTYVQIDGDEAIYLVHGRLAESLARPAAYYREPMLFDWRAEQVTQLLVSTDAGTYELTGRNGQWRIKLPNDVRADPRQVERLRLAVAGLAAIDFITPDAKDLASFGLATPTMTLEITVGDDDTTTAGEGPRVVRLEFGSSRDGKTFARIDQEPWLFRVTQSDFAALHTPTNELRSRAVLPLDPAAIAGVKAKLGDQELALRKTDGVWVVDAPYACLAHGPAVADLLNAAAGLKADEFIDRYATLSGYGLARPTGRYEFTDDDGATRTLLVGAPGELVAAGSTYVKLDGAVTVMTVSRTALARLPVAPATYRSRILAGFRTGDLVDLTIRRSGRSSGLAPTTSGAFATDDPAGAKVDQAAMANLIDALRSLAAEKILHVGDALPEQYRAADAVSLTARLRPPAGGRERTLTLNLARVGMDACVWVGPAPIVVGKLSEATYQALTAEVLIPHSATR